MSEQTPFYRWRPHPWHGLEAGPDPPKLVHVYVETSPFDLVKYEVDKETGYLRVDRPHRTSSQHPTLYGFIPRTFCGESVGKLMPGAERGDQDPLDICVITERPINRGEVILRARVIGGIQMVDNGEADDKIIAVLDNDQFWKNANEINDVSSALLELLRHYFATYKLVPGQPSDVHIEKIYDRDHAHAVIRAAQEDYTEEYG